MIMEYGNKQAVHSLALRSSSQHINLVFHIHVQLMLVGRAEILSIFKCILEVYMTPTPNAIIGGSCQKYHFCHDKSFVVTNMSLVTTKVCLL